MKYRLSNGQRKALLVRGELLRIALPLPLDWPEAATDEQLRTFFLRHLPEITPAQLRAIEETELCIRPYQAGSSNPPTMITLVSPDSWHMVVGVAVGTIAHVWPPRHKSSSLNWPGDIRHLVPAPPTAQPSAPKESDA